MIVSATVLSPCKDCDDRCIGCHTTCGDYAEYKAQLEHRRTEIQAEKDLNEFERAVKRKIAKAHLDRRRGDNR